MISAKERVKSGLRKLTFVILSIVIALFLLSASFACPFLFRSFYYTQINSLGLPETTGYSEETIKEAFDDIMDYCTKGGEKAGLEFRVGELAWTESGKSHFYDVQRLVSLDFTILIITGGLLVISIFYMLITRRVKKKLWGSPHRFLKRGPFFWGPAVLLGAFIAVGIAAVVDYEGFFAFFHHLLFPGKENWLLTRTEDEVIGILPEQVFHNYGLLIFGILTVGCVICILADLIIPRLLQKLTALSNADKK